MFNYTSPIPHRLTALHREDLVDVVTGAYHAATGNQPTSMKFFSSKK